MDQQVAGEHSELGYGFTLCVFAYAFAAFAAIAAGWAVQGEHPIWVATVADIVGTVAVYGFSLTYGNSSLYDPYWSVAPVGIAIYWASIDVGSDIPPTRPLLA